MNTIFLMALWDYSTLSPFCCGLPLDHCTLAGKLRRLLDYLARKFAGLLNKSNIIIQIFYRSISWTCFLECKFLSSLIFSPSNCHILVFTSCTCNCQKCPCTCLKAHITVTNVHALLTMLPSFIVKFVYKVAVA